ncbi:MAG: hypothetical protein HKN64_00020 [Woeseiaceae bacterium]|nr:hypothetical protein [Woeseiaceae bacterium]
MPATANNRLPYLLGAAVILCFAGLVYQHLKLNELRQRVADNEAALARALTETAAAVALAERQQVRLSMLENAPDSVTGIIPIPTADKVAQLEPGFYELATSTRYDAASDAVSEYEISHMVVEFNYDTYSTRLNVGIARSGTWSLPLGIYFDYNNDGKIDSDMAMKFAGDIPLIGGLLKSAYKPVISQNLYSIFVHEAAMAEHVSFADISSDASAASNRLWAFLQDQYETIKAWIFENLPAPAAAP